MPPKRKKLVKEPSPRSLKNRPNFPRQVQVDSKGEKTVNASLMSLAAELRMCIYEYALIEADGVTVGHTLRQPALLATSRQIRREALEIWYYRNEFNFEIDDCDANLIVKFENLLKRLGLRSDKGTWVVTIYTDTQKSWKNLLEWCRRIFEGDAVFPERNSDDSSGPYYQVVTSACEIAKSFRDVRADWGKCQVALRGLRFAVGAFDGDWLRDDD